MIFYEQLTKYICEDDLWNEFETALGEFDDGEVKELGQSAYLQYDKYHEVYRKTLEEEFEFVYEISNQLYLWINSIDTRSIPILTLDVIKNESIYLNFNYIDTLEKTYKIPEEHILYIHGKALREEHLILGHHNTYAYAGKSPLLLTYQEMDQWIEYQINKGNEEIEYDIQIEKYYDETYKDTEGIIARNTGFLKVL